MHLRIPVIALSCFSALTACGSAQSSDPIPPPPATNLEGDGEQSSPGDGATPGGGTNGTTGTTGSPGEESGQNVPPVSTPPPPPAADPSTPVGQHGALRVEGTQLVDESGAPVQLKGVSTMWLNWEDRYSTNRAGLQWMRDNWGITVVRAAMGVEPENSYLSNPQGMTSMVRQIVENAIALGLYVIIDWHAHEAHQNTSQAQQFFRQMAEEFGHYPNVLYETYNEPLLDTDWSSTIKPYHEAVLSSLREVDPDNVVILGSRQWSQRVDEAAADPVAGTNLMYTLHFYSCTHEGWLRDFADQAISAGAALFVTEWGATHADGGTPNNPGVCDGEAQAWHDWMNERQIGWTAWKLDGCNDESCFFVSDSAAAPEGGWTADVLNGHAQFVIDRLAE